MNEEAAEEVYRALMRIGDFLKKAKPESVKSLLNDDARLEIVPTGWKVTPPAGKGPAGRAAKVKPQQPSAPAVEAQLRALESTEQAAKFLVGLGINLSQMRKLATELGLRGVSKMQMDEVVILIVRTLVGSRLDSDALQRL